MGLIINKIAATNAEVKQLKKQVEKTIQPQEYEKIVDQAKQISAEIYDSRANFRMGRDSATQDEIVYIVAGGRRVIKNTIMRFEDFLRQFCHCDEEEYQKNPQIADRGKQDYFSKFRNQWIGGTYPYHVVNILKEKGLWPETTQQQYDKRRQDIQNTAGSGAEIGSTERAREEREICDNSDERFRNNIRQLNDSFGGEKKIKAYRFAIRQALGGEVVEPRSRPLNSEMWECFDVINLQNVQHKLTRNKPLINRLVLISRFAKGATKLQAGTKPLTNGFMGSGDITWLYLTLFMGNTTTFDVANKLIDFFQLYPAIEAKVDGGEGLTRSEYTKLVYFFNPRYGPVYERGGMPQNVQPGTVTHRR